MRTVGCIMISYELLVLTGYSDNTNNMIIIIVIIIIIIIIISY